MNNTRILSTIEITFLNLFVLVLSESKAAQAVFISAYRLAPLKGLALAVLGSAAIAAAGISFGFILGWLHATIG